MESRRLFVRCTMLCSSDSTKEVACKPERKQVCLAQQNIQREPWKCVFSGNVGWVRECLISFVAHTKLATAVLHMEMETYHHPETTAQCFT